MNNPSAFPVSPCDIAGQPRTEASEGMTLRDYFANSVLSALWNNSEILACSVKEAERTGQTKGKYLAMISYEMADEMLSHRSKEDKE